MRAPRVAHGVEIGVTDQVYNDIDRDDLPVVQSLAALSVRLDADPNALADPAARLRGRLVVRRAMNQLGRPETGIPARRSLLVGATVLLGSLVILPLAAGLAGALRPAPTVTVLVASQTEPTATLTATASSAATPPRATPSATATQSATLPVPTGTPLPTAIRGDTIEAVPSDAKGDDGPPPHRRRRATATPLPPTEASATPEPRDDRERRDNSDRGKRSTPAPEATKRPPKPTATREAPKGGDATRTPEPKDGDRDDKDAHDDD